MQNRPKRCLFLRINKQKIEEVTEVPVGRESLRFLPLLCSWPSPLDFHKTFKDSNSHFKKDDVKECSISRQYAITVTVNKGIKTSGQGNIDFSITKLGACYQPEKI